MPRAGKRIEAGTRRLVLFAANKGGVGKSMLCRAHIDIGRAAGRSVGAFDLDSANGSVARLYPDRNPLVGAGVGDLSNERDTAWIESVDGDADDVLLDVPGGKLDLLLRTFSGGGEAFVSFVARSRREIVVVSPVGVKKDALHTVSDAITNFGASFASGAAHHVIVKNGFFGDESDFVIFDGYEEDGKRKFGNLRVKAVENGAQIVWIPRLHSIADALADQHDLTFTSAAAVGTAAPLQRLVAFRVEEWLGKVRSALAETWADPSLGASATAAAAANV